MAKKAFSLESVLFMRPVLDRLSDSRTLITLYSWSLRIIAGFTFLGGLVLTGGIVWGVAKMWSGLSGGQGLKVFFGVVFVVIFILGMNIVIVNIQLLRANDIASLPVVKIFPLNQIVVIVTKMTGEITASVYAGFSLALSLITWIGATSILEYLPIRSLPGMSMAAAGSAFVSGLLILLFGGVISFLALYGSYVLAESEEVLVMIARNTKKG